MTDDEIIAVVQAHKERKKIEMRHDESETWYPLAHTMRGEAGWNFHAYQYRVAPEPRKPREFKLGINGDFVWIIGKNNLEYQATEVIKVREVLE